MGGNPSLIGFGYQPNGEEPFGHGDWAEEVTWKIIPDFYRDADENQPTFGATSYSVQTGDTIQSVADSLGITTEILLSVNTSLSPTSILVAGQVLNLPGTTPLRGFIDAIKPLFQEIQDKLEIFPNLWDANACPLPQLPALAYNVGISLTSIQNLQLINVNPAPFTIGESITGSSSGNTGFLNSVTDTNFQIISIRGPGFQLGETITGSESGGIAVVQSVAGSGSVQTVTVQTFVVGERITGSTTGTQAIIGSIAENNINVDTVTGIGFQNGELIKGSTSLASGFVNGITSDGRTEGLIRSQILNATQLWTTKGTAKGYAIVTAFEGLLVLVVPLWATSCDPDPNGELLQLEGPPAGSYMTYYDFEVEDNLPLDVFFEDPTQAWPRPVESVQPIPDLPEGVCRSYSLRLFFFTPTNTEIEDFETVAGRLLTNLERFRPIYVKFESITFDGPHAATQSWLQTPVIAESYSAASWTTPISGALYASSGSWILSSI